MNGHGEMGCGAEGDRTLDLRIANATLSQLSYRPTDGHPRQTRLPRMAGRGAAPRTPRGRAILASRSGRSNQVLTAARDAAMIVFKG